MKLKCLLLVVLVMAVGCTRNQRAKSFGGTATETLPVGTNLVTTTWKQDSLWLLTRPMRTNETEEIYEFRESSAFGLIEGKVIIQEKRN